MKKYIALVQVINVVHVEFKAGDNDDLNELAKEAVHESYSGGEYDELVVEAIVESIVPGARLSRVTAV